MPSLLEFKRCLQSSCSIAHWSPSDSNLREIARRLDRSRPKSRADAARIVIEVCPGTIFAVMEGIDNSDLRTLLALATAAATKG